MAQSRLALGKAAKHDGLVTAAEQKVPGNQPGQKWPH